MLAPPVAVLDELRAGHANHARLFARVPQCYPGGLNRSVCCKQGICSECYLQVRAPLFSRAFGSRESFG